MIKPIPEQKRKMNKQNLTEKPVTIMNIFYDKSICFNMLIGTLRNG